RDQEALRIAGALFDAAAGFRDYRLPELFCGYERDPGGEPPVRYPVACSPQAWSAGALPDVVARLLGLRADATARTLRVDPVLPPWLDWIELEGLRVGRARLDLRVGRGPGGPSSSRASPRGPSGCAPTRRRERGASIRSCRPGWTGSSSRACAWAARGSICAWSAGVAASSGRARERAGRAYAWRLLGRRG